ncbi:hypothetical protein BDR07DRAFT_317545 [Suillus spraguei]|nr:hypothetical protein BDR07DRAFT_317545 [Suillus spraguei]
MQPNPGDTTNALLLYLIRISVNGTNSVPDIGTLSPSTGFSSSTVWMQTLAYASLSFSVLAAFGAVMGKQWLNSYKSVRGRALEERGIERQMKLDGVKYFRLQAVLQAFLMLLQMSLLLFGLSLSANMWAKQTTISSIIICTTAFGILFYMGTILVSVIRPDSPFQTPVSELIATICRKCLPDKSTSTRRIFAKSSAIRWILETSTNPEIVEAAAIMIPSVQWTPKFDASAAFARLRDNFMACCDKEDLYVKYGKIMAHLCIQSMEIDRKLLSFLGDDKFLETQKRFMHDAFMLGCAAYGQLKNTPLAEADAQRKYWADTRTALRTIVVHGLDNQLSRPDDEDLIWTGDLQWYDSDGRAPSCQEFDWLVDYLAVDAEHHRDDETKGDALLVLSAMQGLGSPSKRRPYINSLIRCMRSARPPRVRHTALRAVCEAREELASITSASMPQGINVQLLNELSRALLTAVRPNGDQTIYDSGPDASFHLDRDSCYIRIICALSKNDEWCQRLTRDGHLDWCISLVDEYQNCQHLDAAAYLLVVFGRIKSSGKDLPFSPAEERWRLLIENVWDYVKYSIGYDIRVVDEIPALVTATMLNLTASDHYVPWEWFANLAVDVHMGLVSLQENQADHVNNGIAQAAIDVALSFTQDLYNELSYMVEQRNISQRDDGASRL